RDGPFRDLVGVNPRYDARSLLTQGALVDDDAVDRFFVVHGIVLPALVALAVSALAWGARRSAARGARSGTLSATRLARSCPARRRRDGSGCRGRGRSYSH